jgi:hypothetical protein
MILDGHNINVSRDKSGIVDKPRSVLQDWVMQLNLTRTRVRF